MPMLLWCDGCGRMTVDPRATAQDIGKGKPGPWDGPCDRCGGRDASWCEVPKEQLEADLREACLRLGFRLLPDPVEQTRSYMREQLDRVERAVMSMDPWRKP